MALALRFPEMNPFVFDETARLSDERFQRLCRQNPDFRLERTAQGELEIMPPAAPEISFQNSNLARALGNWAERKNLGRVYESSAGFTLQNGAIRSPDVSWTSDETLAAMALQPPAGFPRVCPDFVAELRSPSDRLDTLQKKMEEYIANGARLGWLIDPKQRRVYVYRPGSPVEILSRPTKISGSPVLPGFVLQMKRVWGEPL